VSLVSKVQHVVNRKKKGGLICDIRAKTIIMKALRTRGKDGDTSSMLMEEGKKI
jgi:hypothetical protein